MNGSGHKQWIVLLNKIPRGPFTAEEIKDLILKGLLRHNDLVFLIHTEPESPPGAWKFLWQYPEFDSRKNDKEPETAPAVVLEKRHPRSEAQVAEELKELVPLDLQSIRLEDLILKASSGVRKDFSALKIAEDSQRHYSSGGGQKIPFSARNLSGVFALVALIGMGWAGFSKLKPGSTSVSSPEEPSQKSVAEAQATPGLSKNRTPAGSRMLPKPRGPVAPMPSTAPAVGGVPNRPPMPAFIPNNVPRERDRGEIREDEIRRMRAEELRREQEEREQQKRQEAEEVRRSEEEESREGAANRKNGQGRPPQRNNPEENQGEEPPEVEPPPEREPDEPPPGSWVE